MDNNVYQHIALQDPPKFTQVGIFGFCHLATKVLNLFSSTRQKN
jgi:hypothetical protein